MTIAELCIKGEPLVRMIGGAGSEAAAAAAAKKESSGWQESPLNIV